MPDNYLDRSNYVRGLLLLIGKDRKITDAERNFLCTVAKTLDFNESFIENALNELLENAYLDHEPPVFSQKKYAESFLQDAIQLALIDHDLSTEELNWVHSAAAANKVSEEWLQTTLAHYLNDTQPASQPVFQAEKIIDGNR